MSKVEFDGPYNSVIHMLESSEDTKDLAGKIIGAGHKGVTMGDRDWIDRLESFVLRSPILKGIYTVIAVVVIVIFTLFAAAVFYGAAFLDWLFGYDSRW